MKDAKDKAKAGDKEGAIPLLKSVTEQKCLFPGKAKDAAKELKKLGVEASGQFFDAPVMDRAQSAKLILRPSRVNFASNQLLVVLPGDSTLEVAKLSDLAKPQVQKIALGTPDSVPVGRYAKGALEKAGLWSQLTPKFIFTQNVRQSLDYVYRGEVEAGFVYATDAALSPVKVRTAFQVPLDSPILYPIAAVVGFGNEDRALEFIAFVRSDAGQVILAKYGFLKP